MTVIEFAAIGQTAVLELADAVVFLAQSAPALVLFDESVLQIVFIGERPMAVIDIDKATERIVAVMNLLTIG
jgi:hypothetical protein